MVYGPIAAMLVEMFPTRIRYTSMSPALPHRQRLVRRPAADHRLRHGGRDRQHLLRPVVPDRRRRRSPSSSACCSSGRPRTWTSTRATDAPLPLPGKARFGGLFFCFRMDKPQFRRRCVQSMHLMGTRIAPQGLGVGSTLVRVEARSMLIVKTETGHQVMKDRSVAADAAAALRLHPVRRQAHASSDVLDATAAMGVTPGGHRPAAANWGCVTDGRWRPRQPLPSVARGEAVARWPVRSSTSSRTPAGALCRGLSRSPPS